jgi:hypothetical protein
MLRRKAKRQLESSENEEVTATKHGRRTTPNQNEEADDLEKLVFGDRHLHFDINIEVSFLT